MLQFVKNLQVLFHISSAKKKLESESSNLKLLAKFLRINHYKILDISEFPKMKFIKLINSDNIEEKKV